MTVTKIIEELNQLSLTPHPASPIMRLIAREDQTGSRGKGFTDRDIDKLVTALFPPSFDKRVVINSLIVKTFADPKTADRIIFDEMFPSLATEVVCGAIMDVDEPVSLAKFLKTVARSNPALLARFVQRFPKIASYTTSFSNKFISK